MPAEVNSMKSRAVIIILIVAVVLMGILTIRQYTIYRNLTIQEQRNTQNQSISKDPNKTTVASSDAVISVERQDAGNSIMVNYVKIKEKGFIVIRRVENNGSPGKIIGTEAVKAGEFFDIVVKLDEPVANGDVLMATLHRDDGDGKLTFPGPDISLTDASGQEIMAKFFIGPKPTINPN